MSNAPVKKFRTGYVTATIWKNEVTDRPFFTVEIARTYKDDDGNLKNTPSLNHADILVAADLLRRANDWIMEQ